MMDKKDDTISRTAVLELIKEMGGGDAQDDKSKGWDEACDALYEAVERMKPGQQDRRRCR